jgi:hypothetical protein
VRSDAWLEEHRAEVEGVVAEVAALAARAQSLARELPRGRTPEELAVLGGLSADCLAVRPPLERLVLRLKNLEADHLGPLPGLPMDWTTAAEATRARRELGWVCERVTRGVEAAAARETARTLAVDERARLGKKRRPRRALASVDLVDEILRSAATDDLLLRYEDAVVDWGDAETWVLRTRASEPAEQRRALDDAAEARKDVDAANAMISLTLSGRSGQLSDAVRAAAKQLGRLGDEDREAILQLFGKESTPASWILQQLLRDAL